MSLKELGKKWKEIISGESYYSVDEALVHFQSPSSLAHELNITLNLSKKSPKVFSFSQLNGLSSVSLVVIHLIDNCRTHAGKNASVNINTSNDSEFQYIDVQDNGPGIKDIKKIQRDAVLHACGDHHGSSLDLACSDSGALGGIIIPSNSENGGACLRIQIPLDKTKMNWDSSKELRQIVGKNLGLIE